MKNIELYAISVYDDRCIKTEARTYWDDVYTNFRGLNAQEGVKCESCTITSINSLIVYDCKYYLQVYLDNCAYKIMDKQMRDYVDDNLFETDE